jgi:hypothetical protein
MKLLKWGLAMCVLCGATYGLIRSQRSHPVDANDEESQIPVSETAFGDGTVELEEAAAKRLGIHVESAREVQWTRTFRVYGRVVPNPRATTEIHAATTGKIRAAEMSWPTLGQHLSNGQLIGYLHIRVGPEVRLDLQNKLAEARLRQQGEEEVVKVYMRTVESLKKVTDREILARSELDTALVNLAEAKIQATTANAAVTLWEKSLSEIADFSARGGTLWSQPITVPRDGTVVELAAQPEIEVESGSLLLRLVDDRHPLIRLDLPPKMLVAGPIPAKIEVEIASLSAPTLPGVSSPAVTDGSFRKYPAKLVGLSATIDVSSQLAGVWYEVQLGEGRAEPATGTRAAWRPGLQVQAELPSGEHSKSAIAVPATAILFHEGRSIIYVRTAEDRYQRHEVHLIQRVGTDWLVVASTNTSSAGIAAGNAVVHQQAQVLLSKEFLQSGGDAD